MTRAHLGISIIAAGLASLTPGLAFAQAMAPENAATRYILDSALLLVGGSFAILFVIASAFRDAGLSRDAGATAAGLRMAGALAFGAIAFWATGYNLIFSVEPGGLLGAFEPWLAADDDPVSAGRASSAHWFYYFGLAAIGVAIVSSAIAERTRLGAFVIFAVALCGLIFPIAGSWVLGGGFIVTEWRFQDTGAATAHIVGGSAALAAVMIIGPRAHDLRPFTQRAAALPVSTFSAGLMLISLFGVSAAASGSASSIDAMIKISDGVVNQALSAAAGGASALVLTRLVYKRSGVVFSLAGAIGGAVALAADPVNPAAWQALMIGAVSGVIVTVTSPFLARYKIDDAGVVIAAHLFCTIWGVMITPWFNPDAQFVGQAAGAAMLVSFVFVLSLCFWTAMRFSVGVRLLKEE